MSSAVLLVGFGGPLSPEDIRPFLANVLRGRPVPPHRVEEVVRQYELIGGRSPYNALVEELAAQLTAHFQKSDRPMPVYIGMRNWTPTLEDTLRRAKTEGVTDFTCFVLGAYRSLPSWNYYLRSTAAALHAVGGGLRVRFVPPWHHHPLFVEAAVARVEETLASLPPEMRGNTRWFFTAHSIPTPWDAASHYADQIRAVARQVAQRFGVSDWRLVFQSRSGRPEDPWLEPDISDALSAEPAQGRTALVIPLGFVFDHVEVLFDLDIKAKNTALQQGWGYLRAKTVGGHPLFVEMAAGLIASPTPETAESRRLPRAVIVGAGIAGLAAAHRWMDLSARRGQTPRLSVVDGAPRPGGVIETHRKDGFLFESGPDSFITDKPAALRLAEQLGLAEDIIGTQRKHQRSFVVRDGRLHPTPDGFYLLAPSKLWPLWKTPLLSWRGKCRALGELFVPPRKTGGDESLASFVRRRFGRELLDRLAQPMVAGIYSADPETLSLEATFPRFLELENRAGGVIRGLLKSRSRRGKSVVPRGTSGPRYTLFATLKNGLASLVEALVQRLPPSSILLGEEVRALAHSAQGWSVTLSSGKVLESDTLCLAVNAPVAARLIRPLDGILADLLEGIPYGSVATLSAAFRRDQVDHPLNGFGFVVPALEKRAITGCTFSHVKFAGRAPEGTVLLRAFVGGDVLSLDDAAVEARALEDLRALLGTHGAPLWTAFKRYSQAMPQYGLHHRQRLKNIEDRIKKWPGLALAGNGYGGIGLPDSIASGERAADALFDHSLEMSS